MKYFVVSDIHGFYVELQQGLKMAGYDKNNENHSLIVIGDVFDRGSENKKVYRFLISIPQDRLVLIKGNHEQLYLDLLNKDYPDRYDFTNHTTTTFSEIANMKEWEITSPLCTKEELIDSWNKMKKKVGKSVITKWIKSPIWKDYYEVGDFIFTHSFIPTRIKQDSDKFFRRLRSYGVDPGLLEPVPNWRENSSETQWKDARWGCPIDQFKAGLFDEEIKNNKTLVCGHWHTSDFYKRLKNIYGQDGIYFSKNLIGIDNGISWDWHRDEYQKQQNVLIIEDGKCYNQDGEELFERKSVPKIETTIMDKN